MTPEEVRGATFGEAFRGYSPGAVDSLLERVARQIEAGQPFQPTIQAATPLPRTTRGYSMDDVDQFLVALTGSLWGDIGHNRDGGQHFKRPHTGIPADELADAWLTADDHHILQVKLRARGVLRIMGYGDPRDWLIWPFTWILHGLFYRGQWAVEVYERRVRGRIIMVDGRVVYSYIFPSRREAREARHTIADRIQQLASGEGA
jgi:DivIVA domain-containing protein